MKFKFLYIIFSFLILESFAVELTFSKYITNIKENDPNYKELKLEMQKAQFIIDEGLPTRQIIISASTEKGHSADSSQNTLVTTGEISKNIIESGTSVSVSHSKTTRPDRQENVTQVRLTQSLANNMFGRDIRLQKSSLSEQEKVKILETEENLENYFVSSLKNFLLLAKSYQDYQLSEIIYNEAVNLNSNVEEKVKSKIASKTDLSRSKLLVLLKKEERLARKSDFLITKAQIEETINFDFDNFVQSEISNLITSLENINLDSKDISWEESRKFKISSLNQSYLKKDMILQDRSTIPDLSLIVGYNKDDSSRFSTTIKRDETVVGLKLELPFGDTKSKASSEIARINYLKSKNQVNSEKTDFLKNKNQLFNNLNQTKEQLEIAKMKLKLTKEILKEEERRFSIGKIDLETLIELKNTYASYRSSHEQAILDYGNALINWLELNDILLNASILN